MVSFKAVKANSKLTDFEDFREYVVRNSVRNVPRGIRPSHRHGNVPLPSF